MKKIYFFLASLIFLAFACASDDELVCNGDVDIATLNIHFYAKDSSELYTLTLDTILCTINAEADTLAFITSSNSVSIYLNPLLDSTVFSLKTDSLSATSIELIVKYIHSTDFISYDCGYANKFKISTVASSSIKDSLTINNNEVSIFENETEHIHFFR